MYSIKHVDVSGVERVVAAVSVSYDPKKNELIGHGSPGPADGLVRFSSGHAYVMNDLGKTVSVYNLSR